MDSVLHFDEIVSVDSIEALAELYARKGLSFSSEKKFLKRISKDWRLEKKRVEREAKQKKIPSSLPCLEEIVDGQPIRIYGIIHDYRVGDTYRALVAETMNQEENILVENGCKRYFELREDAMEVPDSKVNSGIRAFLLGSSLGTGYAEDLIVSTFVRYLPNSEKMFRVGANERSQRAFTILNTPLEAIGFRAEGRFPVYVDLELRERRKVPNYTDTQERSAYQAEFLRAWKSGQNKSFLSGASHPRQIAYFLRNGVKESRITELAQADAELLEKDPEEYKDIYSLQHNRYSTVANTGFFIGKNVSLFGYAALAPLTGLAIYVRFQVI